MQEMRRTVLDAADPRPMNRFLDFIGGFLKAAAPTLRLYLICVVAVIFVVFIAEIALHFIH